MKRILLAVTMLALVLPALQRVEAADVSVDFFYDNLSSGGSWVELGDYGYAWQPAVSVSNSNWRPYADGYWAYTDVGWTWVSYEDFGWATYHYGRWTRLRDRGWFWVPGTEWGPAWVSWRTGGDYVGWAPLRARSGGEVVYDGRPITGQVDVEFDIGPAYYNFVDVRYIGEPVLRERIFAPEQNVTYISRTVNVTNITYRDSMVYNYGPDYGTLSRYSTRQIPRLTLQRETNVDPRTAAQSGALMRVQGDRLMVAAPLKVQKPPTPMPPKMLKEKIAKPTADDGWGGVSDPKAQAELKQKMKTENPKNIPPPSFSPKTGADTQTAASPATGAAAGANPAAAASPAMGGNPAPPNPAITPAKGKGKQGENAPAASSAAPVAPGAGTSPAMPPRKGKSKPGMTPSALTTSPDGTPEPDARGKGKSKPGMTPSALTTSPDGTPAPDSPGKGKNKQAAPAAPAAEKAAPAPPAAAKQNKARKRGEDVPTPAVPGGTSQTSMAPNQNAAAPASAQGDSNKGHGKHQGQEPPANAGPAPASAEQPIKPEGAAREPKGPPTGAPAKQGQGKQDQGKKNKGEESPPPGQ